MFLSSHDNLDEPNFRGFRSGELINMFEMTVTDIVELCLGNRFRYFAEYPLEKICQRPENAWLAKEDWQFLVSSRVDIAVIDRSCGSDRRAKLVIECQSRWHDNLMAQRRDRKKAQLLASIGVPLIYARQVEVDQRFIRFYTPEDQQETVYNLVTQSNRAELEAFFQQYCL